MQRIIFHPRRSPFLCGDKMVGSGNSCKMVALKVSLDKIMEVWNNWQNPYFKMKLLWWNEIGVLVQMHFLCVELLHMWHDDIFSEKDWQWKFSGRWQAKEFHHQPTRMLVNLTLPNLTYLKQLMIATSLKMKRNSQVCRDVECTLTRTTKSPCPLSMPCLAAHSDPILWQIQNCQNHLRASSIWLAHRKSPHPVYQQRLRENCKSKGLLIAISWRWCDRAPTRAALHCAVCVDTDRHPNGFRGFLSLRHTPAITIGRTMGIFN